MTQIGSALQIVTHTAILGAKISLLSALVLFIAAWLSGLRHDRREPPVLRPNIPFIGHLISLLTYKSRFLTRLAFPIATLPILNGSLYAIFDGDLIQAAQANKDLSFEPFVEKFARGELGYDEKTDELIKKEKAAFKISRASRTGMATHFTHTMNCQALKYLTRELVNSQEGDLVVPNLYIWVRNVLTLATAEALYGAANPLEKDHQLVEDLWSFDRDLPIFIFNLFPRLLAPKAYQGRQRLQEALSAYYTSRTDADEEAAGITNQRAKALREIGISAAAVGQIELALLHVAVTNTIPTFYWLIAFIITRPALIARLRDETKNVITWEDSHATLNISDIAPKCQLLVSCYRETIRLSNKSQSNRHVMTDTTIADGEGRSYLLRKGTDIQMPTEHLHSDPAIWGSDAASFNPDRFTKAYENDLTRQQLRARRTGYAPFGGGRHLCPGRHFAFAENLGMITLLLHTFDTVPLGAGEWTLKDVPPMAQCSLTGAVSMPERMGEGFGLRFKRRPDFENVRWSFTSS